MESDKEATKMIQFIDQEAEERIAEIKLRAREEFIIEKARILRLESDNIELGFEKKQKFVMHAQSM
jgi:V-type H+-transporting ATPase subunit E